MPHIRENRGGRNTGGARPGAGRPKVHKEQTQAVYMRYPTASLLKLKEAVKAKGTTISEVLRQAADKFWKKPEI